MALLRSRLSSAKPVIGRYQPFLIGCVFFLTGCAASPPSNEAAIRTALQQATSAYAAGDYGRAVKSYRQLTDLLPKDAELWFRLGNAYARQGNSAQALDAYAEALVRNPQDGRAWHNRGIVQLEMAASNYTEAIATLKAGDPMLPVAERAAEEILLLLNRVNRQSGSLASQQRVSQNSAARDAPGPEQGVEVIVLNKPQTPAFFDGEDLTSGYSNQDEAGSHKLVDGLLSLAGNTWRKLLIDYEVTPDTLLSFDVRIPKEGEIHAIGLDEDNVFDNQVRLYQLAGRQAWLPSSEGDAGDGAWQDYAYVNQGEWQRIVIPVGQRQAGRLKYLVVANDDDGGQGAVSEYKNIGLSEGGELDSDR
ncbi:tetratricopeptide repeat protein [Gammaproteobacteria bacterium]|nr:tetratricopeptide repeat protein [Gammaproteobacteria bacterium]